MNVFLLVYYLCFKNSEQKLVKGKKNDLIYLNKAFFVFFRYWEYKIMIRTSYPKSKCQLTFPLTVSL